MLQLQSKWSLQTFALCPLQETIVMKATCHHYTHFSNINARNNMNILEKYLDNMSIAKPRRRLQAS
jgi:hypothetical protein